MIIFHFPVRINIHDMPKDEVSEYILKLFNQYKNNLDILYFKDEVNHFFKYIQEKKILKYIKSIIDGVIN